MAKVAEHRVELAVTPAASGKAAAAPPERRLSRFVQLVATMERFVNALGTLAFTWATVVLLGGYPTVLGSHFCIATILIFIEAARMFTRENRLDYQLFFRTRGAFRGLGWNVMILLVCLFNVLVPIDMWSSHIVQILTLTVAILLIGAILCPEAARPPMCKPLRRAISLWSPMVAIILQCPSIMWYSFDVDLNVQTPDVKDLITKRTVYPMLFVMVLLLTISRLQFPSIIKLVDSAFGNNIVFWRQVVLNVCMFAAIVMSVFTFHGTFRLVFIGIEIFALLIMSFGNLQIPAAIVRIVLALIGGAHALIGDVDKTDLSKTHLVPSLYTFYALVLGQGILYIVAGILENFSFILKRSLCRHVGFKGSDGVEYVNLYYADAFDKCIKGAVLAPEKTSLITFAMDSLESDSPKRQLYGVKMMHVFLKKDPLKTKATSELSNSTKTVTRLINILGWTSEEDKDIRSCAAKVMIELAEKIRVVSVPGAMQLIASLMDTVHGQNIKDPLLDFGSSKPEQDNLIQQVGQKEQTSLMLKWLKYCLIPREEQTKMDEQNSHILRCWKHITKRWSVPEEEPSTDEDPLPVQGMLILDKLASFDIENCIEMSRATGLISKIIEFTSNRTDMTEINEIHQTMLKGSSLKLLRRLSSTKGKFGVTLRQKISEHPFLLSHLTEIMDDSGSSQELTKLTMELLRNLAMDRNIKEEIGHIPVIISSLMHAFLRQHGPSATDSDQLLRLISGQALAVLAMDSANNSLAMLAETGYVLIKELTVMIQGDRYKYVASSLLRNIFVHARSELGNSEMKEISYILREVLEGIMDEEGTELEVLVGLSSQICNAIPDDFARELEHGQIKERFIKRLVHALNSNRTPTAHCPGIRRVIVEHAIYMMECNPGYANCFKKYWMMEALLRVERTPSRAENYRFFLGDAGLMEHCIPLSALVSRAKELMSRKLI